MGKRSDYVRKPRDYYPTPLEAVLPLIPHLPEKYTFVEPCAGDSDLTNHLESSTQGVCLAEYDLEPQNIDIEYLDALDLREKHLYDCDLIITNPPWIRTKRSDYLMHRLLETFSDLRPTWFLLDSDWAYTLQASEYLQQRCQKIVAIGRVKWIPDSTGTGTDNASWYLFDKNKKGPTEFYNEKFILPSA